MRHLSASDFPGATARAGHRFRQAGGRENVIAPPQRFTRWTSVKALLMPRPLLRNIRGCERFVSEPMPLFFDPSYRPNWCDPTGSPRGMPFRIRWRTTCVALMGRFRIGGWRAVAVAARFASWQQCLRRRPMAVSSGFCRRSAVAQVRPQAPAEGPAVSSEPERPLTVRPARKKRSSARASLARAAVPGKTGPVSIYEDPTLRTGDAVMTKNGMRVFSGARYSRRSSLRRRLIS